MDKLVMCGFHFYESDSHRRYSSFAEARTAWASAFLSSPACGLIVGFLLRLFPASQVPSLVCEWPLPIF